MKTTYNFFDQFTTEQMKAQYLSSLDGLKIMLQRSLKTGSYNGFTTAQLQSKVEQYSKLV